MSVILSLKRPALIEAFFAAGFSVSQSMAAPTYGEPAFGSETRQDILDAIRPHVE